MKTLLLKPFERYSEWRLIIVGMSFLVIGILLANVLNTRFDGALDAHFAKSVSILQSTIDLAVDVVTLTLFLFLAGKWVNRKTRLADLLSTVLIARIPMYSLVLFNINNFSFKTGEEMLNSMLNSQELHLNATAIVVLVLLIVVTLLLVVWSITLLYNGYKVAVNAKDTKAIVLFIAAIVLAEVASKLVISLLSNS